MLVITYVHVRRDKQVSSLAILVSLLGHNCNEDIFSEKNCSMCKFSVNDTHYLLGCSDVSSSNFTEIFCGSKVPLQPS